jgi:hypothetical protein
MLSAEPQMEQRHNNLRTTPAQCVPFGSAWALVYKRDAATAEEGGGENGRQRTTRLTRDLGQRTRATQAEDEGCPSPAGRRGRPQHGVSGSDTTPRHDAHQASRVAVRLATRNTDKASHHVDHGRGRPAPSRHHSPQSAANKIDSVDEDVAAGASYMQPIGAHL